MNQQDIIGASADTMAVVFTGLQTQQIFQLICLAMTIASIIFGIVLKIVSAVKEAKAGKQLTDEEKDAKLAALEADNKKLQSALEKISGVLEPVEKKVE